MNLVVPILSSFGSLESRAPRSRKGAGRVKGSNKVKGGSPRKLSGNEKRRLYELNQKGARTKELMKAVRIQCLRGERPPKGPIKKSDM